MGRVRKRIDSSTLVVADLTGANPNVYLDVGYAWGRGKSTVLLAAEGEKLEFDVQGQRLIFHKNITNHRTKLKADLKALSRSSR